MGQLLSPKSAHRSCSRHSLRHDAQRYQITLSNFLPFPRRDPLCRILSIFVRLSSFFFWIITEAELTHQCFVCILEVIDLFLALIE
jgi:hypothetical protein